MRHRRSLERGRQQLLPEPKAPRRSPSPIEATRRAASLAPGTGHIDLTGYATLDRVGAALDYEQRLRRPNLSAFAHAWAGATRTDRWRRDAGAMAGLKYLF